MNIRPIDYRKSSSRSTRRHLFKLTTLDCLYLKREAGARSPDADIVRCSDVIATLVPLRPDILRATEQNDCGECNQRAPHRKSAFKSLVIGFHFLPLFPNVGQ